ALLVGAAAFLFLVWPAGRESKGAARLVWAGWIGAVVATIVGIALDGAYAAALPLGDAVKPSVISDVLDTRFGRVWLLRLVLLVVVLRRKHLDELREVVPRYSRLALAAISVIIVSGAFQAWRQLGSLSNLRDTDYGKLLTAKLLAFGVLIITAAFSREIVN